jgi:flagellar motor switch protein FliN/FliY
MSAELPTPEQPDVNPTASAASASAGPDSAASAKPDAAPGTASKSVEGSVATATPPTPDTTAVVLPDLSGSAEARASHGIELLSDVELNVKIELGRATMLIEDVLRLGEGSVVELDKLAGDPVDVLVNDRLVARGEVLVMNDNFCVRISEIVTDGPEAEAA